MTKASEAVGKARNKTCLIFKNNKGRDGTLFLQLSLTDKSVNLQRKNFSTNLLFPCCSAPSKTINTTAQGPSLPQIFSITAKAHNYFPLLGLESAFPSILTNLTTTTNCFTGFEFSTLRQTNRTTWIGFPPPPKIFPISSTDFSILKSTFINSYLLFLLWHSLKRFLGFGTLWLHYTHSAV